MPNQPLQTASTPQQSCMSSQEQTCPTLNRAPTAGQQWHAMCLQITDPVKPAHLAACKSSLNICNGQLLHTLPEVQSVKPTAAKQSFTIGMCHGCRLADPDDQAASMPAHLAAAKRSRLHHRAASCNGLLTGQEPLKLTAVGRARGGGLLGSGLPGSAAAAAVVNLYTGHSGAWLSACVSHASKRTCPRMIACRAHDLWQLTL